MAETLSAKTRKEFGGVYSGYVTAADDGTMGRLVAACRHYHRTPDAGQECAEGMRRSVLQKREPERQAEEVERA